MTRPNRNRNRAGKMKIVFQHKMRLSTLIKQGRKLPPPLNPHLQLVRLI
uniref:Uncharacterized protein n=1 Tax=Rhizophora mucronata TaxID=61149 RepID=A0A2P2QSF0_RHIMU